MAHFTPLDTTFNHLYGRRSIKIFIDLPVKLRQFSQRRLPAFSQKDLRITPVLTARTLPNVVLRLRSEIRKLVRIMKCFRFAPGLVWALYFRRRNSSRSSSDGCRASYDVDASRWFTHRLQLRQRTTHSSGHDYRSGWQSSPDDSLSTGQCRTLFYGRSFRTGWARSTQESLQV